MVDKILEIAANYAPSILAIVLIVINSFAQKSNLVNGIKLIKTKAEELEAAAQFKTVQDQLTGLMMEIELQQKEIKALTDSINKIERPDYDKDN